LFNLHKFRTSRMPINAMASKWRWSADSRMSKVRRSSRKLLRKCHLSKISAINCSLLNRVSLRSLKQ
jgi:hypothetical protein